jgi:hypothetical protein
MAQVIVASIRKRNLALPDDPSELYNGPKKTYKLRALNNTNGTDEIKELVEPARQDEGDENVAEPIHTEADANVTAKSTVTALKETTTFAVAPAPDGIAKTSSWEKTDGSFPVREPLAVGPRKWEEDEDEMIILRHCDQFR